MTEARVLSGLGRMFRQQRDLQRVLHDDTDPAEFHTAELMAYIREQALAVTLEVGEALGEVGHKSWATSTHVNRDAFVSELRDAWQHLMNLMLVVGVTPGELVRLTTEKQKINLERHASGYDGVTTKCPACKRAYDDTAVKCTPVHSGPDGSGAAWCEVSRRTVGPEAHPIIDPVNGHGTIAGYKLASDCPGTPHRGHTDPAKPCPMDVGVIARHEVDGEISILRAAGMTYPGEIVEGPGELRMWTCGNCGVRDMTSTEHRAHLKSADHKRVTDTK